MKILKLNKIYALLAVLTLWMGTELKAQTTVCPGVEYCITLDSMRGTIQWQSSLDGGATYADINGETGDSLCFIPTADAFYRAVLTTEPGCAPVISDAIDIQLSDLSADAGADQRMCEMDSVMLGGSPAASGGAGGYTYNWLGNGLATPTGPSTMASPAATTDYVFEVTDTDGCVARDTVNVLVDVIPASGDTVFAFVPNKQYWIVPRCIDSVHIMTYGADGGTSSTFAGGTGGKGGLAEGDILNLIFNDSMLVFTGGGGVGVANVPGYNGGGQSGIGIPSNWNGQYGGGASVAIYVPIISAVPETLLVAGGGGGGGAGGIAAAGDGGNGGISGESGGDGAVTTNNATGGFGATQTLPGIGGAGMVDCATTGDAGDAGLLSAGGQGGDGIFCNGTTTGASGGGGGGGGGGIRGGGGGGGGVGSTQPGGGGGGGASMIGASIVNGFASPSQTPPTNPGPNGNGTVVISW